MFRDLFKRVALKRVIAVLVIIQFVMSSVVVPGYAAAGNLRPVSAKSGNRLPDIRKDLDIASQRDVQKVQTLAKKDGGNDSNSANEDVFKSFLGNYKVSAVIDNLAFGTFVKHQIDLAKSPEAKKNLEKFFNDPKDPITDTDVFYTLTFKGMGLGIVKKSKTGAIAVKKIIDNIEGIPVEAIVEISNEEKAKGINVTDILVNDFVVLERRADTAVPDRMTVEFNELRDYVYEKAKTAGREKAKEEGLALAGGKGLSLSIMSRVVDVPPGYNVTTTAYFKFVKDNPEVWNKIYSELKALDTMDDQKRDIVAASIRDTIMKSHIPDAIKSEVCTLYHQMNVVRFLAGKASPTPVAVRSSGTKEDIHVKTWLPVSTGSQAGQSDTFLNVKGDRDVLDKLRADWGSLFTDRAISYRDDATFLMFSGAIDYQGKDSQDVYWNIVAKLREYSKKLNKPEYGIFADLMSKVTSPNPGSVNLIGALTEILEHEDNPEIKNALDALKEKSEEVVHPEQIGIDVVIMQMVKSYLAGVLFTVNPATKMAGVPQALYHAWEKGDDSLVYRDKANNIVGTKPMVVSFDVAFGYGENVVGGKVNPDKFIMGTYDGDKWMVIEKRKGNKLIQMKDREEVVALLKDKMDQPRIESLAEQVKEAIAYDEVGKKINGILVSKLYGTKYLKAIVQESGEIKEESDKDRKARVQSIAQDVANMIKDKKSEAAVVNFIKENFEVATKKGYKGIHEDVLASTVKDFFTMVREAQKETDRGMHKLAASGQLGNLNNANAFINMIKEVWENKEFDNLAHRQEVLAELGMTALDQRNLSYLIRALIDNSFTSNYETTQTHQDTFTMTDDQAQYVARMGWAITEYYKDARDIEFAIEIDATAPEGKQIKLYTVDDKGNMMGMDDKGQLVPMTPGANPVILRLYNVQARPYTAEYLTVDVVRARTEVDEKYLDEVSPKPIATGTKGENATHAYTLRFDPNKDVAWHADQIRRLKSGEFTAVEREQIAAIGFNPADYAAGQDKQLPIALYLLEADPNHDPIMRLVDSVVTIRGGDTCHAAIFCREQGIPAVTGAGKILLNGRLLETGDGLTVDANNGNIYPLDPDPAKRIPINYVKFKIKPYGIPGDHDGMAYPKIGQIIAAASAAQQNSPIMLAVDADGNSLTRAEFKGEEIGVNVFAGYGYHLMSLIADGKMAQPVRTYVSDIVNGKVENTGKFTARINDEIFEYLSENSKAKKTFVDMFGKEPLKADGVKLLKAFDITTDVALGKISANDIEKLSAEDKAVLSFMDGLSSEDKNFFEYVYGEFQRRFNYNYNIVTDLENHPWIMKEIDNKLKEKGYSTFQEYVSKEFLYFYNLMGFTIAPDQKAKNRAYDFAQDKIRGMPGSEVFSWPGVNPLVGLRGSSLEIEAFEDDFSGNQLVLDFLFNSVIEANENTHNQAWFYVFVRNTRELDVLDQIMQKKAEKTGVLPKQVGIMIEVPSAALVADELAKNMRAMQEKYKKYGVVLTFFSFGTNDYSHLAAKGDREDPRMKLEILDPAAVTAVAEMKSAGYFYDDANKKLPLVDEGADVMLQLIEAVVDAARGFKISTSLCGEAITALVGRGAYATAGKIMNLLDSFGVSMMKVRLPASMTRVDTMAATKEVAVPQSQRKTLLDLSSGKFTMDSGVIKGEVIFVDSAEDLIPDALKGLQGADLQKRKDFLKQQSRKSAQSTMRTYDKIIVLSRNFAAQSKADLVPAIGEDMFNRFVKDGLLKDIGSDLYMWTNLAVSDKAFTAELESKGIAKDSIVAIKKMWQQAWDNSIEGLERRGIDWDDLQYANAVIQDADVNLEGWDVYRKDKSLNPTRIKAVVKGIGAMRSQLEGKFVTLDYASKKLYEGDLAVQKKPFTLRRLPIRTDKPQVDVKTGVKEDANNVYQNLVYHPKVILAYERGNLDELNKIFDEYMGKIVEELEKITQETDLQKQQWLLGRMANKVNNIPEQVIRDFMKDVLAGTAKTGKVSLKADWNDTLRQKYFDSLKAGISELMGTRTASEFISDAFKTSMRQAIASNPGAFVVHTTTSLNCVAFNSMFGGFLVEQVNPNPDYGILGASRAIGDMWEINRMELGAFKQVWESLPVAERKNFGLQITEFKGTQAGAVVIAWRNVLKDMNIIPGKDGLEVGVNIATPADTLAVDKYFEYFNTLGTGLSFVTYDTLSLGAAWSGVDIYWKEWRRLSRKAELMKMGSLAASIVEGKIEAANKADPKNQKKLVSLAAGSVSNVEPILILKDGGLITQKSLADIAAQYTPEVVGKRLNSLFDNYRLQALDALKRNDNDKLQKIIDEINAKGTLEKLQNIAVSPIAYVEDHQTKPLAVKQMLEGSLVLQMPFAGAGSRMDNTLQDFGIKLDAEQIRLANIDIWNIAQAMGNIVYDKAKAQGATDDQARDEVLKQGLILDIPSFAQHIGFAEREMLALEQGISDLKKTQNLTDDEIEKVRKNLKIIISVSAEIKENTHKMFLSPSRLSGKPFFGFSPENIVFVAGGYGPGYSFDKEGNLKMDADSSASWNHGFAFIELAWIKGPNAYTLTGKTVSGQPEARELPVGVFDYVQERGAKYGCIRRINDLILMHPQTSLDVEMFNAFLNLRSLPGNENVNMYLEMMANPTNQKGGLALTEDGKHLILFEGLGTKDARITQKLDQLATGEMAKTDNQRGIPYNRLYGFYDVTAIKQALAQGDMPFLIKAKNGVVTPEIPTGDVTWAKGVKALAGVRRTDLLIKQGVLPNEQRDGNNNTIYESDGVTPKQAYSETEGVGSGAMVHDCKEAKYIKDGLLMVSAMDNPKKGYFAEQYYKDGGTMSRQAATVLVKANDEAVYAGLKTSFSGIVRAVKELDNAKGAVVIGANVIFENAGSLSALNQARFASGALNLAVWVNSEKDKSALQTLGVDKVATIYVGLNEALSALDKSQISRDRIVLINSDLDLANIKDEFKVADSADYFNRNLDLRAIHVSTPRTGEANKIINAVTLAFAKAIAVIFNDQAGVRSEFKEMVRAWAEKGLISAADARSLEDLTKQLSDIPLVSVSEEVAKYQIVYEETMNKI